MFQPTFEFHVSRRVRDRYQLDETLFALSGNVIFANFYAARIFAQKMNQKRDLVRFPEQAVRAGQINAMGLIDEILHLVAGLYRQQQAPNAMRDALDWLYGMLGQDVVDAALKRFCEEFPPVAVYRRDISIDDYLNGQTNGIPNRQIALEEFVLLWLANANPAFAPFIELFDDTLLNKETAYRQIIPALRAFFDTQPVYGPDNQNLIDMLRSPAIAVPHSLQGQLEYIRQRWGVMLGKYLYRLLSSLDLIREEDKVVFGVGGQGPARVLEFGGLDHEPERFSPDKDWMPRLVLLAKNAFVWLDQLTKKYGRPIATLADIPDEELDFLARWGFTGLWLIGLWERSAASKDIKIMRGNPDAVASAYSLFDYSIAADLGGEAAYQNLRDRCWPRGIRLASDMVPNHMGIDSRWVIEHPDWFISLDYPPFPSYTFNGADFSPDPRVSLHIEDHYFTNTDAAVVFKRYDHWTGETKYIYHGNDGTSMPWNDTAQLNYLKPEVREAVIQTILSVARRFPVIRFDAAMTLAKKHYQRLWFPEPGAGGAIPSRAEFGLTREQFDAAMPVEFWREVVDRVAQEVPDTLLLAEAFWLMEGYFVRTLGMHRVYNSAFMNMLRDEKNAEYRLVMKNTLEFDPEILKRYVNFMNNPDERTAVDQFGKGDKYFGICTLMATLPGLPMFGHGQIEGYTEKYGMEYRRAYWDEQPDGWLVGRHEREVFPLLRKRYLFAEVRDFLLYDFYTPEGNVNEDVFAYSNQAGSGPSAGSGYTSLVVYHNKFASTRGWIKTSAAYAVKTSAGEKTLVQRTLGEGLGLSADDDAFVIFRDHFAGLEYIRSCREFHDQGLYVELEAYNCRVYLDFRQVQDNEYHQYRHLAEYLQGRGVPSIEEAMKEIFLQPIHHNFRELVNAGFLNWLIDNRHQPSTFNLPPSTFDLALNEAEAKALALGSEIKRLTGGMGDATALARRLRQKAHAALSLPALVGRQPKSQAGAYKAAMKYLRLEPGRGKARTAGLTGGERALWGPLLGWLFTHTLGGLISEAEQAEISRSWIDEWLLGKIVAGALQDLGLDEPAGGRAVATIKILIRHHDWLQKTPPVKGKARESAAFQVLQNWLADGEVQRYIGVNRYQDVLWFNQEAFSDLAWWLFLAAVVDLTSAGESAEAIAAGYKIIARLLKAEAASGFQVEKLLEAAK
jgi:glycosidase